MFFLEYLVGTDGFVYKKMKKTYPRDANEDSDLFTITVSMLVEAPHIVWDHVICDIFRNEVYLISCTICKQLKRS